MNPCQCQFSSHPNCPSLKKIHIISKQDILSCNRILCFTWQLIWSSLGMSILIRCLSCCTKWKNHLYFLTTQRRYNRFAVAFSMVIMLEWLTFIQNQRVKCVGKITLGHDFLSQQKDIAEANCYIRRKH